VFIGKPCDVAGVQAARRERPGLDEKLGLTVAFFCAGVPSTRGTLELLKSVGVEDPASVRSLRYRGNGWPGRWTVEFEGERGEMRTESLSYEESWGFLQRYRQWRCYICPDHTGEFADIAVGDPWYRPVEPGEPGKSLLVARTPRGREVLHAAAAAGYIRLETKDASLLPRSQPNLLRTRGGLWGRLAVLRLFGAPVPRYRGFPTFRYWVRELGPMEKVKSLTGRRGGCFASVCGSGSRFARRGAFGIRQRSGGHQDGRARWILVRNSHGRRGNIRRLRVSRPDDAAPARRRDHARVRRGPSRASRRHAMLPMLVVCCFVAVSRGS
jgi:hypothetical protein